MALVVATFCAATASAQGHDMSQMTAPQPGAWTWQFLTDAALVQVKETSKRGAAQFALRDWEMLTLARPLAPKSAIGLSIMTTSAPWTLGGRGAPQVLQSGGTYRHAFVHDRTHPMPAVMQFEASLSSSFGSGRYGFIRLGAVGAPALGPEPWQHRASSSGDLIAPLSHHWQDATHQSFGVITAGAWLGDLKLETSAFNARESDEEHQFVDYRDARLDSWSARVEWGFNSSIRAAAWTGWLAQPHRLDPYTNMHRFGASITTQHDSPWGGNWSSLFVVAENVHHHGIGSHHLLHAAPGSPPYMEAKNAMVESSLDVGTKYTLFGRAEYVEKNGEELGFLGGDLMVGYPVKAFVFGVSREIGKRWTHSLDIGARGNLELIPESLRATYGTTSPMGGALYVRIRPTRSHAQH